MYEFNPFEKPIAQVTAIDLVVLRKLREGWHCDFKRAVERDLAKQAKFLSSFANTYGGWIFYGVDQQRGSGDPLADTFPGIAKAEVPGALQTLRNAAAQHLSPPCYYQAHVVDGPCVEIGLPDGHAVICVHVPRGEAPPYIDKTGRVYRRIGDSSEPGAENDRSALDRMWAARRSREEAFLAEIETNSSEDANRTETSVLHMFVTETPSGEAIPPRFFWEDFLNIMRTREPLVEPIGVTLPYIHRLPDGAVARGPRGSRDLRLPAYRWRGRPDGLMVLSLAFGSRIGEHHGADDILEYLEGYEHGEEFAERVAAGPYPGRVRILDVNMILPHMLALAYKLVRLGRAGRVERWFLRMRLDNAAGTIPFLDTPSYLRETDEWGLPYLDEARYIYPPVSLNPFVLEVEPGETELGKAVRQSVYELAFEILQGFGIPDGALSGDEIDAASSRALARIKRMFGDPPP